MVLELLLLALTSSPSPRPVYLPEDYEELQWAREQRAAIRAQRAQTQERWNSERAFHLVMRAGARVGIDFTGNRGRSTAQLVEDGSIEVAVGFSKRLAPRYALQGNISLAMGFGRTRDESLGPLFDSSADVTLRIGSWRVYFGLGPIARFWRIFGASESFRIGGGALWEIGFLFGNNRELDLAWRVQAGGFRDGEELELWYAQTLAVAWHF